MRITITIDTDNSAFDPLLCGPANWEVARILRDLAETFRRDAVNLEPGDLFPTLRDCNGDTCGKVAVSE